MAKYSSLLSLYILVLLLDSIILAGEAVNISIINNCDFTVWPAMVPTKNELSITEVPSGFSVDAGKETSVSVRRWIGLIWGRTLCSFDEDGFSCQTGDCGTGMVGCSNASFSSSPVTVAAFDLGERNTYNVSVTDGYNLPMMVYPKGGSGTLCAVTGCVFDLSTKCPAELSVMNKNNRSEIIACDQACNIENGCDKVRNSSQSLMFKDSCPRAYSYGTHQQTAVNFVCMGDDTHYTVTFCSSPNNQTSLLFQPGPPTGNNQTPSISPAKQLPKTSIGSIPTGKSKRKRTSLIVALSTSAAIAMLLFYGVLMCVRKKKATETAYFEITEIKKAVDSLQFDFDTIRIATSNFADDKKLGEGGFGEVYKGKLENGQEIAVKRLSKNSGQGAAEFKTEVVLVAKLQHKNLVKLLGFCMSSNEKILVYEFLPNSSLDRFLFDQAKQESLDWQTRFKIIVGIARGLLYLHEDSRLKVIHRDLKASNILLDEYMNPKISDFGLAKVFGVDQSQGDTNRIVGTYGYMAPEYAITGHYSVKSDVYRFGVIVLEIVSGRRNRFFRRLQYEEALLHRAWRLWNEKTALDLVDEAISDNFPREEVLKCIHIGLLCIQEDAVERPRMTSIVAAFNGQEVNLQVPKPPNFFGTNNNFKGNQTLDQHHSPCVHTGPITITDLDPRD